MIRFIKNLFNGILSFFGGLFSGKKKPQLATQSQGALQETAAQVKETASQAAAQVKETASQATSSLKGTQVQETASQAATQVKETASKAAFFLTGDDARGFKSSNGKPSADQQRTQPQPASSQKSKASQSAATAKALNLSKPKVTTQYGQFSNYGDRRRPGANMSNFLDMARQIKTAK